VGIRVDVCMFECVYIIMYIRMSTNTRMIFVYVCMHVYMFFLRTCTYDCVLARDPWQACMVVSKYGCLYVCMHVSEWFRILFLKKELRVFWVIGGNFGCILILHTKFTQLLCSVCMEMRKYRSTEAQGPQSGIPKNIFEPF
jgi:hypothetical protein